MLPLTDKTIRASFANASRKEVADLTLPTGFDDLDWESLDFLGWRDPKMPKRAYAIVRLPGTGGADGSTDSRVIGVLFRQGDAAPGARAQCTWCQDVTLPNEVVFYSAKRSGASGRNGNTIGTLVCADFQCSTNARRLPPEAYLGFDADAARDEQVERLRVRVAAFAESL